MNALFTADFDEEGAGLPNVVEELAMFEHAGVGLAREEGYRLFLAMAQLKQAHGLASIRLFGKVLGTTSDYYVVEGKHATPPTPTLPSKNPSEPELPGAGPSFVRERNDSIEPSCVDLSRSPRSRFRSRAAPFARLAASPGSLSTS